MAIKVVEKSFEKTIPFYKLRLGTVFVTKDGDVSYDDGYKYMKVRSNDETGIYNAVNLTNGIFSLEKIDSDTEVKEIRAELTLEDSDF